MNVLVFNVGSSSLKWSVVDPDIEAPRASGASSGPATAAAIREIVHAARSIDAVGHRIVHGGRFTDVLLVDDRARRELEKLAALDPLHAPPALAVLDAARESLPGVPQYAAFDTAFHATIPEFAALYPIPYEMSERHGVRRFGFHGWSVAWASSRVAELLGSTPERLVVAHLGSGCSVTAVRGGLSFDTTMGMTPLEGMMMATRSGSIDPSLVAILARGEQTSADEVVEMLNRRSGLLGVSGVSGDLREVERAATEGSARASLARAMFIHSLKRNVGAMIGVLGGVDVLVLTGGIGENDAGVRREVIASFAFAGLGEANTLVIRAREDAMIARAVRQKICLDGSA